MKRLAWMLLLLLAGSALFIAQAPSITPTTLPNGTVGVPYTQTLTLSPTAEATWSISAGSLPPGLTLTPLGVSSTTATISGTPTTAGPYTFTVQTTIGPPTSGAIYATQSYTVTVAPALPTVSLACVNLPGGTVGVSYSQNLTASGGYGAGTYTFALTAGSLPPGLQLNAVGAIYGIPTAVGGYGFTVQVTSHSNVNPSVTASCAFSIIISPAPVTVTTSSLPAGTVGVPYSQPLAATGGLPPYTWQLTGGSLPGGLTLASYGTISGTPTTAGTFTFQVTVTDSQQNTASGSVSIKINPALTITTTSLPGGTVGTSYTATTLAATGGTPPYTWSVVSGALPTGLSLSSAGVITGTPTAAGTFSFTLQVTDSVQATATETYSVTVVASLSITTQSPLPGGEVGVAYTQAFAATGGTQPYTWSVYGGTALPTGLTLSATGSLTGTPTAAGTFNFTVQVADSAGHTATQAFTITVTAVLTITTATLPNGTVGTPYSQTLTAAGVSGTLAWSISTGALPAGITLSSAGSLSGTPSAPGTFTFTVSVTGGGQTATKTFTITVAAALTITTATLPNATVGTPYSQTLTATGVSGTLTWSISTGALPGGITLSSAGALSGTPSASGTFNFTVSVTGGGQTATQSFTITVAAALTITTATLPNAVVGTPYSQTLAAAGGTGVFTWSISTGALPAGITLSSAGSLSGTPSASGTFTFTVSVTGGGQTATQSFTITVGAVLTITTPSALPGATFGVGYNQALSVTGGAAPFTWSLVSGTLPTGIALNTGSLNGIPSAPGTFTFTVSVAGGGQTATQSFTITVGVPTGPSATFAGLPATGTPDTQPALGITIPNEYPLDITGQITLTFKPDSGNPDDPNIVFVTTNSRTLSFTVAANTTQPVFSGVKPGSQPPVQIGTVSGTITLTLDLTAAGIDITPSPAPSTTIVIPKSAPVITSATVTGVASGGFNLVVVGYATSRDMASANVTFTAASGVTLSSSSASVSLTSVFTNWYQNTASAAYGSQFSLTMPFSIANGTSANPLTSVSVQLTNSQGNSNSMSATY
jgi:hypothetical protein